MLLLAFILQTTAIIISQIQCQNGQSLNCNIDKVSVPTTGAYQFIYQCFQGTMDNPPFATSSDSSGSKPTEYNELNMSPNTYTIVPVDGICLYTNIYSLNIARNKITSVTGVFVSLKCLKFLRILIMSNNLITSPLKNSDFDDTFSAQLEYIDLSSNQIPSIDSDVFIKASNGASRFGRLQYLNLANNRIKEFDMLWPLTIPSSVLNVNISSNPINTLTNQFNAKYNDPGFSNSATGNRFVDVSNNILESLDDINLLQYGLTDANDFAAFLNLIANYDLRQNTIKRVTCQCSGSTQVLIGWYASLLASFSINTNSLINKFTCINSLKSVFLVDTSCQVNLTARTTTRASNPTAVAGALVVTTSTPDTSTESLYYLFFFIIPLLLLVALIICCCFRPCNKCMYRSCNTTCCQKCRPGERRNRRTSEKKYDATIVYSEYDESWIQTQLLPKIAKQGKAYKIHLMTSYHRGFTNIDKIQLERLKSSKRILLVFSKNFLREEWNSEQFQNELKNICANDPDCVVIPINMGDLSKEIMEENIEKLEEYYAYDTTCFAWIKRFKHSTILKDVEPLHSGNPKFAFNLQFLLPIRKNTGSASIVTDSTNVKHEYVLEEPSSIKLESETASVITHDDVPLVSTRRKHKTNRVMPSTQELYLATQRMKRLPIVPIVNAEGPSKRYYDTSIHDINIMSKTYTTKQPTPLDSQDFSSTSDILRTQMMKPRDDISIDLSFIKEEDSRENMSYRVPPSAKVTRNLPKHVLPRDVLIESMTNRGGRGYGNDEYDRSYIEAHEKTIEQLKRRGRSHEKNSSRGTVMRMSKSASTRHHHSEALPRELYTNYLLDSENEENLSSRKSKKLSRKNKSSEEIYGELNAVPVVLDGKSQRTKITRIKFNYQPPRAERTFMHIDNDK